MTAQILDGRKVRDLLLPEITEKVSGLVSKTLTIIQVGDNPDSNAYIQAKKTFAEKIGVIVNHLQFAETSSEEEIIEAIESANGDPAVRGIIVQLPLPLGLDREAIINTIDPQKDVDALTPVNVKEWLEGREDALFPATVRGIRTLLDYYKIDLFGKKLTVIGRSLLVGKPVAAMCLAGNATVTVCHSKTPDLAVFTREADIVIVAAGRPGLLGPEHVRPGQVIIDVGINTVTGQKLDDEIPERKLIGDVQFDSIKEIVQSITPVPGGVGPMTVLGLYQNFLDLNKEE